MGKFIKENLYIIIAIITIGVLIHFWFFDNTPKKVACDPYKEYCSTLDQYDGY